MMAGAMKAVDMSSEAIDRRLRELGQLYELGMQIRGARWLGTLEEIAAAEAARKTGPDAGPPEAGLHSGPPTR